MNVSELINYVQKIMPTDLEDSIYIEWINILESNMYIDYISKGDLEDFERVEPTIKTIAKGSEKLYLTKYGTRWNQIYYYFLFAQISIILEEFSKANNYIALYNSTVDEFVSYYFPKMINTVRNERMKEWR